jgi:DNA-binding transcriptional regulator YdaS (Cro superfamily)
MSANHRSEIPNGQQLERLAHIEFLAYFIGKVSRKCIMSRFDIGEAAATRDLSLYNDMAPGNIIYDPRLKYYVPSETFECRFNLSAQKCLDTLSSGFGDYLTDNNEFKVAHTLRLSPPNLNVTAAITRAITTKRPLEIEYLSVTSGQSKKTLVPFTILDSGLRWHIRAYDRQKSRFADFVINRIINAKVLNNESIQPHEESNEDSQWTDFVDLIIQVHPKNEKEKRVIEHEYGMIDGVLIKRIRKAFAGYLLRSWDIDCSEDASQKGHHIFLHLKNAKEIAALNVDSFKLAVTSD